MKIQNETIPKQKMIPTQESTILREPNIKVNYDSIEFGNVMKISSEECYFNVTDLSIFESKRNFKKTFKIKRMEVFSV